MTLTQYVAIAAIVLPIVATAFFFLLREIRAMRHNELAHIWEEIHSLRDDLKDHLAWHLETRGPKS